ncbi:hypothetical protein BsWGS_14621 [Bradybaena similaris]
MEPKDKVATILNQVSELSESEKLALYLKLPDVADESSRDTPTKMSERNNLALSWIKAHYMEDKEMFVPKQDVYEQYRQHCESAGNNPMSSGDFGKVMKLVFPHVHHRRLGQRGQSKYFYKGLKKREEFDTSSPTEVLPDVRTKLDLNLLALSCQLVCEWAMQLLGRPFVDIRNLSEYLVSKGLSCGKTAAKFSLLSGSTSPPKLFDRDRKSPNSKQHDRQILVQRKLQHNELIREHKEKLKEQQKQLREQHSTSASLGRTSLTPDACSVKGAQAVHSLVPGIPGRSILPRPLSVQPYVQNASSSYMNKKRDMISFTLASCFEKASASRLSTVASGMNPTQATSGGEVFATGAAHLTGQTSLMDMRESDPGRLPPKRCHSTSVVERQSSSLLFGLLELTEQTLDKGHRAVDRNSACEMDDDKIPRFSSPAGHSSTSTDAHTISSSSSEAVSRGLSSCSSLANPLSNTQRTIARMFESPGLRVSADGLLMPQHPKRYGDNISPDRSSLTKRKCTTSLGVTKPQSLETSMGPDEHSDSDIHRSRPYSCPVSTDVFPLDSFGKEGKSLSHNLFAELVHTRETGLAKVKLTEETTSRAGASNSPTLVSDKKMDDKKKMRPEQPKKSTSLCHFVQKPTVINRPQRILHPVSSCSDLKQEAMCADLSQPSQEAGAEKQSYIILNSLLSSNYDTMTESLSSFRALPTLPFTSPLTSSFMCTSTTALASNSSLSGSQLRLATNTSHTIESPSILSSLSSRSAFVPVTSHKLQVANSTLRENESVMRVPSLQKQSTELIPKDQELLVPSAVATPQSLSNDCTQSLVKPATSQTLASESSATPATDDYNLIKDATNATSVTFSNYGTTTASNSSSSSSSSSSTLCRSGESMSSGCESVLTTPVPAGAPLASEKSDGLPQVAFSTVKTIPTSFPLACSPALQEKSFVESTLPVVTPDACHPGHSFQSHTTTSPITPTKRASRNRFTPIRPKLQGSTSAPSPQKLGAVSTPSPQKLGGMTTPSPQKKDMRCVSTILKEQRMKCAQDLLVNLANNYQGNVKLQLPAELLGLSSGGKTKSADVCVTIRSPSSSVNMLQPKNTQLLSSDLNRQLWPLTSPSPPHKEITVVVEPVSQSLIHSTLGPSLSSCLISSTPTQLLQSLQQPVGVQVITHNTVLPKPLFSPTTSHAQSSHQTQVGLPSAGSGTKVIILPASLPGLPSTQVTETVPPKPIIVEDDRGNKYSVDQKSVSTILPQNFLDNSHVVDSVEAPSNSNTTYIGGTSCLLNVSEMNAHVIGPDSTGQTYLLVPNSEPLPTTTAPGFLCHQTSPSISSALAGTVSRSQISTPSGVSCSPVMIQPGAASSSALLSELSQLASSGQTLIQHSSGISAFHKCSSSTQSTSVNCKASNEADEIAKQNDSLFGQSYDYQLVEKTFSGLLDDLESQKKHQETVEVSRDTRTCEGALHIQGVRKRKASNSQDNKHEDKKRLNSLRAHKKDADDDDVFIVKIEDSFASKAANESLSTAESHTVAKSQSSDYEHALKSHTVAKSQSSDYEHALKSHTAAKSQSLDHVHASKSGFVLNNAQSEDNFTGTVSAATHDDSKKILMDTETLLGMIEDSKSMTVKETIKALNELRAKHLQNGNKSYSTTGIDSSGHRERPTAQESTSQEMSLSSQADATNSKDLLPGSKSNQKSALVSRSQSARCNSVSPFKLGESSLYSTMHPGASPYATVHKVERTSRRHISLNLESLESDALLDTEPALDHKLVGDIRDTTFSRSDQKTSIGVAVKSAKSKSLRLLSDNTSHNKNKPKQLRQDIKSSKATLLNDKKDLDMVFSNILKKEIDLRFVSDTNDQNNAELEMCSKDTKQSSKNPQKNATETLPAPASEQRRSISCVHDMLHGSSKHNFMTRTSGIAEKNTPGSNCQNLQALSLTNVHQAGENVASEHPVLAHCLSAPSAGRFQVQIGADHSQTTTTDPVHPSTEHTDAHNVERSEFSENELPGEIADFITESMSAGHSYTCSAFKGNSLTTLLADLVRNGQSDREQVCAQDGQNATVWRSVSVPNTITSTYYDCKSESRPTSQQMSSESLPVSYVRSWSTNSIVMNPNMGDQQVQATGLKDVPKDAWAGNSADACLSLGLTPEIGKVKDLSTDHSSQPSDGCVPLSSGTFLSPIGPAKLTRRSSVERSSSGERTLPKAPVEVLAHKSVVDKSMPRMRTPTDRTLGKVPVDRSHAQTPVDKSLNVTSNDKAVKRISRDKSPSMVSNPCREHTAATAPQQPAIERDPHRQPVNRVLSKSPAEKVLGNFVYESLFSCRSFDPVVHSGLAEGVKEDRSHNQTPVSDAGYSSVSQTPLSDVGYSSVSPSPVMMSLPGLFGECGRQELTSPATIFMPVRSDSVLSIANNNGRGSDAADTVGLTLQTGSQGGSRSVFGLTQCLRRASEVDDYDKTDREQSLFHQSFIGRKSSVLQDVTDGALLEADLAKSNAQLNIIRTSESHIFRDSSSSSSSFSDVEKFMSVQLNCIPTPPHSPSTSPQHLADSSQSPLSFNVSASLSLPPTHSHQNLVAPICSVSSHQVTQFSCVTTISSHSTCLSSNNLQYLSSSPGFSTFPGRQSPNAHPEYSRSPYGITHPCSSPHQYNPHPSPPFTPSSQRCLASPRCPTPCSHRSLMSPRCATPCGDSNSAPNRFMPIQTSGIVTTPLTVTQTYIQPIRPVVTLASMANQNNRSNLDLSKLEHFAKLPLSKNIPRLTEPTILDLVRRDICDYSTLHKSTTANMDVPTSSDKLKMTLSVDCDTAPYHRKVKTQHRGPEDHKCERSGHPGLILSLTGDIGSVSRQGMQTGWTKNIPEPASPTLLAKSGHSRSVTSYHPQPTQCPKPRSGRAHPEADQGKPTELHEIPKPNEGSQFESGDQTCNSSSQNMTANISVYSTRGNIAETVYNRDFDSISVGASGKDEKEHRRISLNKDTNQLGLSNKNLKPSFLKENEQLYSSSLNYPSSCTSDFQFSLQLAKHNDQSESSSRERQSQIQDNKAESYGPSQFCFQRLGHDTSPADTSRKSSLTAMLRAPAFSAGHILQVEGNICNTDNTKPKSFHQISDLPTAHYSGTAPNVDLTKASFALSNLQTLTQRSDSGTAPNVDLTKASLTPASLPASLTHGPSSQNSSCDNTPDIYFINLSTSNSRQTDHCTPGNQDELDETLSILKSLDSQYFQQDDGSSSPKEDS